jgi:hypothetical protein
VIVAVFVSDRPADLYLDDCVESVRRNLPVTYADMLCHTVYDLDHRLGMAGAVQAGFDWVLSTDAEYVLWIEEDFLFDELPLAEMRYVLDRNPHLAQVVLKRQPWSDYEKAAGGQIETNPSAYTQCKAFGRNVSWVEHSTLFSLNPCLIPRRVVELGWPSGPIGVGNETGMTEKCVDAGYRFAYFGRIEDPPRCEHVGHVRGSGWRL